MAIERKNLSALPNCETSRQRYMELIRKVRGWENVSDEEAKYLLEQFDLYVTILIAGLPPERLDKAIEEINKKNGNSH